MHCVFAALPVRHQADCHMRLAKISNHGHDYEGQGQLSLQTRCRSAPNEEATAVHVSRCGAAAEAADTGVACRMRTGCRPCRGARACTAPALCCTRLLEWLTRG